MLRTEHNEDEAEERKLRISETFDTLDLSSVLPNRTIPIDSRDAITTPIPDSGAFLALH